MTNPFDEIKARFDRLEMLLAQMPKVGNQIEIITRTELQKRLSITEPTVIRWEKNGKIPVMRFGSNIRYNWPEVIKALEGKKDRPYDPWYEMNPK